MTAVRPSARFGEIDLDEDKVISFKKNLEQKQVGLMADFLLWNLNLLILLKEMRQF